MSAQMINSLSELKAYYRVNDIIASLEKNLETHKKEYAEAVTNWRKTVLATLENTFDEYYRKGKFDTFDTSPFTKLTKPVNCEDGYIKAINIFKLMTDEKIELDVNTANNIFNDDWSWAQAAKYSNSSYLSK
mgnify:FL=1